ncbi:DNA-binding SARP family transcriptional activator [Actinophytocola oryzae]|uniref:DNA-binding SARP family transcriptional activator n=2 Tax=Actinophytocola oryzae TaxID=502181 RepID=A0A4R7VHG3_9PSEU|nr:DNA-binding SARP family transcriptional activator [Actinophytocola oryzae]
MLTLFGGFQLQVDGAVVKLAVGAQRLVAFLAVGGPSLRTRIASALWGDGPEHRAQARLRTTIWRVNNLVPGLVTSRQGLLVVADFVDSDVRRFAAEARAQLSGGAEPSTATLELGAGELLPGWEDDWVRFERDRFKQLQLHMMEAIAAFLRARGDYGIALDIALHAVRADPLRESARRAVIDVHLAEGNHVEALREYRRFHNELLSQIGVRPSRSLSQLVFAPTA